MAINKKKYMQGAGFKFSSTGKDEGRKVRTK